MEIILIFSILISIIIAIIFIPRWIKKCQQVGLVWEDMNKYDRPKNVASSGGIVVIMSFILGVLFYIAIRTFIFNDLDGISIKIFSLLTVILILAIVGLTDDLLGWKHGGLSPKFRVFMAIASSIPLIVINAGSHDMSLPFFGIIHLGIIYTLFFIPIGIMGASVAFNMIAGFNGLEAGQGIIIISFLSLISYLTKNSWLTLVGLCMVGALLIFYYYNKYPAKVFPGDILTYSVGAVIAGMAILGNFERIAVILFIPYILEVFLKARGRIELKKFPHSFGMPEKDGSLELPYNKIYSLTHLSLFILKKFKKKVYEKDVVYFIFMLQIIICILVLIIFWKNIF